MASRPALTAASGDEGALAAWLRSEAFRAFIHSRMRSGHIPGVSLAVIDGGQSIHAAGFGLADLQARRPMTADTVMNIASVSKTITCTAVMQLWEQKRFDLDDPIDAHLPFTVRNPAYPDDALTFRHLLLHLSSIADGPAYDASYACGDPRISLEKWLHDYLTPGAPLFDARNNFHDWKPGARYEYSNVAYGLLGLLVERLSGRLFADYCRERIFAPLRMASSSFRLADVDRGSHATGYDHLGDGDASEVRVPDPAWQPNAHSGARLAPHCLYGFPTVSDGLARTSARELSRFLLAYMQGGVLDGTRILREETVALILSDQQVEIPEPPGARLGITWRRYPDGTFGHTGGDPGVSSRVAFRPGDGRGVVILANVRGAKSQVADIARSIFEGTRASIPD